MTPHRHPDDAVVVDLDDLPPDPGPRPEGPRGSPWLRAAALVGLLALVAALVVAHQAQARAESEVLLVAGGGELLAVRRPSSPDDDTLAAVRVDLRNAGRSPVALHSVRTGGAGSHLRDDLQGDPLTAEGAGAAAGGVVLAPGGLRSVVLLGALRCPGVGEHPGVGGDLVVEATAADGARRPVDVAAPPGAGWSGAFVTACSSRPSPAPEPLPR